MVKRIRTFRMVLLAVITLVLAVPAYADGILYTFSGANGLSGTFTLAIDTPSSSSCDLIGCSYFFASPFNTLSGSYGQYSFSGVSRLDITDLPSSFVGFCCTDSWIVRGGSPVLSPLSGNAVGGRSVTGLSLFIHPCCTGTLLSGATLIPPAVGPFPGSEYTVVFSDNSIEGGQLNTITLVPEPPSVALLSFGVIGLLVGFRHLRARE